MTPVERLPSDAELAEIQGRAGAATEGPWNYGGQAELDDTEYGHVVRGGGAAWSMQEHMVAWLGETTDLKAPEDAAFIAHARTDVPRLVEAVRVLQGQVERVRALHQPMRDGAFSLISWAYCSCGATETHIAQDGYPSTGPAIYPCATLRALDASAVTE